MAHTMPWPKLAAAFARFGLPVAVVDLESTGGDFYGDRVTEVAVIRFENGRAVRYGQLVNPQQPIPEFVARLTGINSETVREAPPFSGVAAELLPLLRGTVMVAHNSRFDYAFLCNEFHRAGLDFASPALCTVRLSRRLYPQFVKHNLDSIIERFGIATVGRHRAMADVEALCGFLEHSLSDMGEDEWVRQCLDLMNPCPLPDTLPQSLAESLYRLPDTGGVLVWFDEAGCASAAHVCEHAYSQTAVLLRGGRAAENVRQAVSVRFFPAIGSLHALWLKAQIEQEYGLRPSESLKRYLTVDFVADERGVLQARIVLLLPGRAKRRTYGFFLHKKAARRALAAWAAEHGFCPSLLGILPVGHTRDGVPCPVHAVGRCGGGCAEEVQNERILAAARLLPLADWGRAHEVEITETDLLTGERMTFRCAGGTLEMSDGSRYFDETLPAVLKARFKKGWDGVKVLG